MERSSLCSRKGQCGLSIMLEWQGRDSRVLDGKLHRLKDGGRWVSYLDLLELPWHHSEECFLLFSKVLSMELYMVIQLIGKVEDFRFHKKWTKFLVVTWDISRKVTDYFSPNSIPGTFLNWQHPHDILKPFFMETYWSKAISFK